MAIDSAAWIDDEAELLLNVTLEYTTKIFEGLDWEGIRSKYAGILEKFRDPRLRIRRLHNIVFKTISNISGRFVPDTCKRKVQTQRNCSVFARKRFHVNGALLL